MKQKYYLLVVVALVLVSTAKSKIPIDKINSNSNIVEYGKLAVYMAKRFISPKTNTLVITENCQVICSRQQNYQTVLLNYILVGLNDEFTVQLFLGHYNDRLWDYHLFIVDSHESYETLRYTLPSTQQERFFNFLILLTWSDSNELERQDTLYKIFKISLSYNVRNVVVMSKAFNGNHISFYTYEQFHKVYCWDNIIVREINRFENGTLKHQFLFPDNINDYNGCWLNVSAHKMQPLLTFDGDVNNETHLMESNRLSGIEGDILKVAAKALNFKIRLRFTKERNIIDTYRNSMGCFGDLDHKRAHLAIGAFSSSQMNNEKYSMSFVYHTTPLVFVVRSGLCFGPITQLINPLCKSIWIFLLICFFVSFILTKIVEKKPKVRDFIFGPLNKKPICSMFVIFLGNSLPTQLLPKRNFARFLMAAWLLLSFEVRNGYQGKMFDSLRFSKRIPVPQTISQLIEQDYNLLTSSYKDYYPGNKTEIMRNTTKRLDILQMNELRLTSTALLDTLTHYNYKNWNTSTLTYVKESIHSFPCVMYFRKHSILRSSIDRILNVLSGAGINSHIAKKHVKSYFQNMNTRSLFVSRLANDNLAGLYIIYVIILLISMFVFILELLTRKSRRLLKLMDSLNSV